jgi:predicted TIM-barrel fold metal-dependent hydrolase
VIIDIHGHTNAPPQLYAYKSGLLSSRGYHGKGNHGVTNENLAPVVENHLKNHLDKVGTDIQFLSPRPFQLMHSEKPDKIVHWWNEANNDVIKMTVDLAPTRYRGVCGLPQAGGVPAKNSIEELERCVKELGFVGCMINPDPWEGEQLTPGMGDLDYWGDLYAKMVELDVPALIHSAACKNPWDTYTNYFITQETLCILSMLRGEVFKTFPNLKIIVAHGGGSIPYHIGRWRASFGRHAGVDGFDGLLKQFYFDSVLYNQESLELLFKLCGTDRCMFATENPGTGSYQDPKTGKWLDDTKPLIEAIDFLTEQDRKNVFEDVARKVFTRFQA